MPFKTVFKRYEYKYMITFEQKERILDAIAPYMALDKYGRTTIRNVYFDTNTFRLIRRSIEKPVYKEKIRIRSYERATVDSTVFVELKKKYKHVVYKRRVSLPEEQAVKWVSGETAAPIDTQISREIDYFCYYYGGVRPSCYLCYDREAFYLRDRTSDFRITFDDNIRARYTDISLLSEPYGEPILPEGKVLMEIKCSGGIPLWMVEILSREKIYKTSFSKYGTAYRDIIIPKIKEGVIDAGYNNL